MSNEKADEFLSWRGRLSSSDACPEQGLDDKELSWRRLAERLEQKPARSRAVWWVAAACLVMALLPATHFFRGGPAHPMSRTPTRVAAQPVPVPARPAPGAITRVPTSTAPRRPGATHIPNSNYGEFAAIKTPIVAQIHSAPDTPVGMIASTAPAVIASTAPSVNAPLIAAQPRPSHALRIVYLNELEDKTSPSPFLAIRQPAFLRLSIASSAAGSQAADQTPSSLIKINIGSPNH